MQNGETILFVAVTLRRFMRQALSRKIHRDNPRTCVPPRSPLPDSRLT